MATSGDEDLGPFVGKIPTLPDDLLLAACKCLTKSERLSISALLTALRQEDLPDLERLRRLHRIVADFVATVRANSSGDTEAIRRVEAALGLLDQKRLLLEAEEVVRTPPL